LTQSQQLFFGLLIIGQALGLANKEGRLKLGNDVTYTALLLDKYHGKMVARRI